MNIHGKIRLAETVQHGSIRGLRAYAWQTQKICTVLRNTASVFLDYDLGQRFQVSSLSSIEVDRPNQVAEPRRGESHNILGRSHDFEESVFNSLGDSVRCPLR